jgi:AraC-like DNA-binding protein
MAISYMDKTRAYLYYWNDRDMYVGMFPNNAKHRHLVLQIEIGIHSPFCLQIDGESHEYRAAIIAPNVPHRVDDHNEWQLMLHMDPECLAAKQLLKTYMGNRRFKKIDFSSLKALLPEINTYVHCTHPCNAAKNLFDAIVNALLDSPTDPPPTDCRIKAALNILRRLPEKKISTREIAESVCLSESRFTHLFKYQMGIPFRRYLLWLRLRDAVEQVFYGMSFTNAAHHAGFSDSAHLSRTFKQMSGMTLTDYLKNSQFIQAISCIDG